MTHTSNRLFDELAKLMTDAAGAAQGVRGEIETIVRSQGERLIREMDVVPREEFEAMRELALNSKAETERLAARVAELEKHLGLVFEA